MIRHAASPLSPIFQLSQVPLAVFGGLDPDGTSVLFIPSSSFESKNTHTNFMT